jgi:BirA family transcriptional regulator, biotin operon repressor / biotin---[acetyl-CoA-carboxylase] ligase
MIGRMQGWFDRVLFEKLREPGSARGGETGVLLGRNMHLLDRVESTNDSALLAAQSGEATGAVFIAREQTKGRGRRGNTWSAEPGQSLLMSVLYRYRGDTERLLGLSLVVGLAVRDAVQECLSTIPGNRILAQVKWPNDVLVSGKKISGVLVETRTTLEGEVGIVMGVGLNLHVKSFPADLPEATSLALLGVAQEDRRIERVTAHLLAALEKKLDAFFRQDFSPFLPELVDADYLHEKRIRVGQLEGRGSGFDTAGRLLILDERGQVVPVMSGTVEIVSKEDEYGERL